MARKKKRGKREPNGQLSRRVADRPATALEAAGNMAVVIDARMRMHGLSRETAARATAGFALGRLVEGKEISSDQMTAAQYFIADRDAYHRGILAPGGTKEARIAPTGDETTYEQFVARARQRWESVQEVITECCREQGNNLPKQALDMIVLRDIETPSHTGALRIALNALVRHYLVGKRRAREEARAA